MVSWLEVQTVGMLLGLFARLLLTYMTLREVLGLTPAATSQKGQQVSPIFKKNIFLEITVLL